MDNFLRMASNIREGLNAEGIALAREQADGSKSAGQITVMTMDRSPITSLLYLQSKNTASRLENGEGQNNFGIKESVSFERNWDNALRQQKPIILDSKSMASLVKHFEEKVYRGPQKLVNMELIKSLLKARFVVFDGIEDIPTPMNGSSSLKLLERLKDTLNQRGMDNTFVKPKKSEGI